FHNLILALLEKATSASSYADEVAMIPELIYNLIRLWLSTNDTGTAAKAGCLLYNLLKASRDEAIGQEYGAGQMWRRVFRDKDVYGLFFEICGPKKQPDQTRSQKTIAQARLLEFLPNVGRLSWLAITQHSNTGVESSSISASKPEDQNLLSFAACFMVDTESDVLMHRTLINFYSDLLACSNDNSTHRSKNASPALDFMLSRGLHERTIMLYLDPKKSGVAQFDLTFLQEPAVSYIATYAVTYPEHFLESQELPRVREKLYGSFNISAARWARGDSPTEACRLLSSLPRQALVPDVTMSWEQSPLALLSPKLSNPDVFHTLARVFHGPPAKEITMTTSISSPWRTSNEPQVDRERVNARTLYQLYDSRNPDFWKEVVSHAKIVAMKEKALAAIDLISAVITAVWSEKCFETALDVDQQISQRLPNKGIQVILDQHASGSIIPYLLSPAETFSHLVGGRGDVESAAYKVAGAKYDTLKLFCQRIEDLEQPDLETLKTAARQRLAEGIWGKGAEVGGRIATLEL
ncbi:hypothetical protein M501DRAFT_919604, partial [Patellaria atrata CBS 101060]